MNSILIKLRILVLLFALPILLFAQDIQWDCTPTDNDELCDGSIISLTTNITVARGFDRAQVQTSTLKEYSDNLGSLTTNCGKGCSSTNFFEMNNSNNYVEGLQDVIAVNPMQKVVASVNFAGILIQPIFNPDKQTQINLNFSQDITIPSVIIHSAYFNQAGNLEISYISLDGNVISQTIPINYHSFENNPASAYQWVCSKQICTMYATLPQGKKVLFTQNSNNPWGYNVVWPQARLAWFQLPCGIHCSDNYFVDYQTGQVSPNFYLVYALNINKRVVAIPKDDNKGNSILITPIFGNGRKGFTITRNFSNSSYMDVVNDEASFDQKGNLLLDYFTGHDFTEVKETIPIDYAKIAGLSSNS